MMIKEWHCYLLIALATAITLMAFWYVSVQGALSRHLHEIAQVQDVR